MQLTHGKPPARAAWFPNHRNTTRKYRFSSCKITNSISKSWDSESLQTGVSVGRQKLLTGWLLARHVHKDEDGKISNKEESEHGSFLSRRSLRTIGAAVDWMGMTSPTYQGYVGHTAPIPTNRFIECSSVNITGHMALVNASCGCCHHCWRQWGQCK